MIFEKTNPCNRKNFEAYVKLLEAFDTVGNKYEIRETYLDYGADMKWETVHAEKAVKKNAWDGDGYQMLSPRDWEELQTAGNAETVAFLAQRKLDEIRKRGW